MPLNTEETSKTSGNIESVFVTLKNAIIHLSSTSLDTILDSMQIGCIVYKLGLKFSECRKIRIWFTKATIKRKNQLSNQKTFENLNVTGWDTKSASRM